jgi:hypothetical protein
MRIQRLVYVWLSVALLVGAIACGGRTQSPNPVAPTPTPTPTPVPLDTSPHRLVDTAGKTSPFTVRLLSVDPAVGTRVNTDSGSIEYESCMDVYPNPPKSDFFTQGTVMALWSRDGKTPTIDNLNSPSIPRVPIQNGECRTMKLPYRVTYGVTHVLLVARMGSSHLGAAWHDKPCPPFVDPWPEQFDFQAPCFMRVAIETHYQW